jgi:hypothetical protein
MGYSQSELAAIFVSTCSCAPRVIDSPRQRQSAGPQGRVCSTPLGGARQDLTVGYVLQSAAPGPPAPGRVPGFTGAVSSQVSSFIAVACTHLRVWAPLQGLPRWCDRFGQYGIKVRFWGSGILKTVILVENHPQARFFRLAYYHPL